MIRAVFGTGGFGREVMPIVLSMRERARPTRYMFVEDSPSGISVNDLDVVSVATLKLMSDGLTEITIAVADPGGRAAIARRLEADRWSVPFDAISLLANFYAPNSVGHGAIICAYCSIHPNCKIGRYFHCNIYSYVAHDCVIGDFVTFAPRVNCNGNVWIEDGAYIGTAAVLRHGSKDKPLRIGRGAIVGMGAVVTRDVPAGAVVVGNPARILKWREGFEPSRAEAGTEASVRG